MLLFGFIFILALSDHVVSAASPKSQMGVLDLSHWQFERDGIVSLNGEWEFYWQQLLDPTHFHHQGTDPLPVAYLNVPQSWRSSIHDNRNISPDGFGTYRLLIQLDDQTIGKDMALHIPFQFTSYRLWVNSTEGARSGTVGKSSNESVPQFRSRLVPFTPTSSTVEVIVQVSNFHHREGGLRNSIKLGLLHQLELRTARRQAADLFLFGGITMMALYNTALYFWLKHLPPLYLGIFSLIVSLRGLVTSEQMIQWLLPQLPWSWQLKMEYISSYLALPVFIMFMHSLYPLELSHVSVWLTSIIGAFGGMFTLLVLVRLSSVLIPYFEIIVVLLFLYLARVVWLAVVHHRSDVWVLFLGGLIFAVAVLLDMLHYRSLGFDIDLTPYGLFLFMLLHSFALAARFSSAEYYAMLDYLVQKPNRRALVHRLRELFAQIRPEDQTFSIVMFDIDGFKYVNDTFGHDVGDSVLKEVARITSEQLHTTDVLGRWGGEEFLVIAPGATLERARHLGEMLRRRIEEHHFTSVGHLTASFGVACRHEGDSLECLIKKADNALYQAKAAGGNAVESA